MIYNWKELLSGNNEVIWEDIDAGNSKKVIPIPCCAEHNIDRWLTDNTHTAPEIIMALSLHVLFISVNISDKKLIILEQWLAI